MGRKKIYDDEETINISIRGIKKADWLELENHIGASSKSQWVRDMVAKQIQETDIVLDMRKEILDIEKQIESLKIQLKDKNEKLQRIMDEREKHLDDNILLEQIISVILDFEYEHRCIWKEKVRLILKSDFNDCISFDKVYNTLKSEYPDLNWVQDVKEAQNIIDTKGRRTI